jgi:hypothetical protein
VHSHPCGEKPSVVADIGLRLSEGLQELKLDQQLAPAREAVASALVAGSTNVFNAVQGIRDRWAAQRQSLSAPAPPSRRSSVGTPAVEISRSDAEAPAAPASGIRPLSLRASASPEAAPAPAAPAAWGAGIGSFFTSRWGRTSPQPAPAPPKPLPAAPPTAGLAPEPPTPRGFTFQPRNLDEEAPRRPRDDDAKSVVGMAL